MSPNFRDRVPNLSTFLCVACGSDGHKVARTVVAPVVCDVLQCGRCGLLRRETLLRELSGRAKIGRQLYPDYEIIEERVAAARQRLWQDVFPRLEKYRLTRRLLDIGSARGHFLVAAQQAGWQAEGLEPSQDDSEFARTTLGVNVRAGVFSPGMFSPGAYDAVTLWNVLDHFLDPKEAVLEIHKLLRPGGILALRLPNGMLHLLAHRALKLLGKKDMSVFHNYAFGRRSLTTLLASAGFSKVSICNAVPSSGDPYRLMGPMLGLMADFIKGSVFGLSQLLYIASGRTVLVAPSFLAFAPKDSECP